MVTVMCEKRQAGGEGQPCDKPRASAQAEGPSGVVPGTLEGGRMLQRPGGLGWGQF